MIVYHGSTLEIHTPDVNHSSHNLDFGKGFYVTTVKEQAERWAKRKADLADATHGVVTTYELSDLPGSFIVKQRKSMPCKNTAFSLHYHRLR